MAIDKDTYATNQGSGRYRLPARLGKDRINADYDKFVSKTTTQRNALSLGSGGAGAVVFDSTLGKLVLWNGTAWRNLDGTALS